MCPHPLLVRIGNTLLFIVSENTNWHTVNVPPESALIIQILAFIWLLVHFEIRQVVGWIMSYLHNLG